MTDQLPWHADRLEQVEVARMLIATDFLSTPDDVVEFIYSPERYSPERDLWIAHGRPYKDAPGWGAFAEAMDRHDGGGHRIPWNPGGAGLALVVSD